MAKITNAVQRGVRRAAAKEVKGVFVNCASTRTDVTVIKPGVVVSLRNWIVNTRTGEAKCKAYASTQLPTANDPLAQYPGRENESTLRGGTIEEIIWSVVMAVAMGAYDHVPE